MQKRKASHIGCFGMSGTGKTSYVSRYAYGSNHRKIFIFDHEGEFSELFHVRPAVTAEDIFTQAESKQRIICYDPSLEYPGDFADGFADFSEAVFELARQVYAPKGWEVLAVVDEIQKLVSNYVLPAGWRSIVQTGRRNFIDSFIISQQPNELHNAMRTQFTEVIFFRILPDETAGKFARALGMDIDEIARLPDLHYLWKNTATNETRHGTLIF